MRIIPFRSPLTKSGTTDIRDWSQQELADFYRAHRLLVENGVGIGMDRGISDAGDPWMAFYDSSTQDVFMHVARIERSCVLLCDQFNIRIVSPNVADLIARFEIEVQSLLRFRQEKHSNILLHPSARIIMSITALFLLFKFEQGGVANAKGMGSEINAASDFARKHDLATSRIHTALGKLYDSMDAPAAVAALAGVILTIELANLPVRDSKSDETHVDQHADHAALTLANEADDHLTAGIHHTGESVVEQGHAEANVAIAMDTAKTLSAVEIALTAPPAEIPSAAVAAPPIAASPWKTVPQAVPPQTQVQQSAAAQSATPIVTDHAPQAPDHPAAVETLASKAVASVMTPLTPAPAAEPNAPATQLTAALAQSDDMSPAGVGDISYATLAELETVVGVTRTSLSGTELIDTLNHFISLIGDFESEQAANGVLIEQSHVTDLASQDIGIWTNVMSDGSEITIVGQIDIVDHVIAAV